MSFLGVGYRSEEYILNKVYFGFYAHLSFVAKLTWFKIYFKLGTICVDLGSFWGAQLTF